MAFPDPQPIATNGVELEVFVAGEGRPLVLCHGWPEHAYSWRHQVEPLIAAGYQVVVPNQRGYGASSRPTAVEDYDIVHLTGDLVGLLDHFDHRDAVFVGHDWGAIVVWNLAMMHPERVAGVINLSVPFMARGDTPWVEFWEQHLGQDFYIVHFNRQPGVADRVFGDNCRQFLRNLYRTRQWLHPAPDLTGGMPLLEIARRDSMPGDPLMPEQDLEVFATAFDHAGFTGGINWYRNFSRNWHIIGEYEQRVAQPVLMIYGDYDSVPKSEHLDNFVDDLTVRSFPCGHWIQQECPQETNAAMLSWLQENYPT